MPRKRISMQKIRDIIRLKETTDMSNRQIARALKVARTVVTRYLQDYYASGLSFEQLTQMPDSQLLGVLEKKKVSRNPRYEQLVRLFPYFVKELGQKGVTLHRLWKEYRQQHPEGYKYSRFCYHYQMWKNASEVTMHMVHKAGDKMFVDYAGENLGIVDITTGHIIPVEVFVAILGFSQLTYVEASFSQKKEDWLRCNDRALWYFGGVSQAIVPDNLKNAVSYSNRYEPGINPTFDDFAQHYNTVIIPTRVREARDKALAENAVGLVYQRIYAPLRNRVFYSLEELNEAIWELLEEHNNTAFQRLNMSRRELFEEVERKALKALPAERYAPKQVKILSVGINYHVELREDRHYYSVPHYLRRRGEKTKVKVIYDDRTVAIYYDNIRVAQHKRDRSPNQYSTLAEHMPSNHRYVAEWNPERFVKWAKAVGEDVALVVEKVLKSRKHPEQAYKVCMGLLNLPKEYGPERVNRACRRAHEFGTYSYTRIKNILERGLDVEHAPGGEEQQQIFTHENVRGSHYYH